MNIILFQREYWGKGLLAQAIQWNLHKTNTIREQPFGRYREVVFLGRFRLPAMYVLCSMSHFLLQMNLGALLTAPLAYTSFEKAVETSYS